MHAGGINQWTIEAISDLAEATPPPPRPRDEPRGCGRGDGNGATTGCEFFGARPSIIAKTGSRETDGRRRRQTETTKGIVCTGEGETDDRLLSRKKTEIGVEEEEEEEKRRRKKKKKRFCSPLPLSIVVDNTSGTGWDIFFVSPMILVRGIFARRRGPFFFSNKSCETREGLMRIEIALETRFTGVGWFLFFLQKANVKGFRSLNFVFEFLWVE